MKNNKNLEELLGAKWKIRILNELIKEKEINISSLTKRTRSFFKNTEKYLELLKKYEIINEKKFGKIRLIIVNNNSPIFNILEKLINCIEEKEKQLKN